MPNTVAASFDRFIENISLTGDHKETAETRRESIVSLLGNSFTILDSFPTGSIPRNTALKTHADLDVFVVLHHGKHIKDRSPEQVLQAVRDALATYRTNVRKNGQAVTLYYKTWPHVDIVPVSRVVTDSGNVDHYDVPDASTDGWIASRPHKHANAMDAKALSLGGDFKAFVRMLKEWNVAHSELLRSRQEITDVDNGAVVG
jgi:hypothetical protein